MHRVITDAPKGYFVDHIDGNPLNNQRHNLRLCTNAQNCRNRGAPKGNTSGFKGVTWNTWNGKWQAQIGKDYKRYHAGYFESPSEAARAYNAKATELFGEYARLNVIPDDCTVSLVAAT
nr:HNH endonuclease [Paenibacillus agricola]